LKKSRFSPETYIQGILNGDRMLLSRAITLVESTLEEDQTLAGQVMEGILPFSGNSIRIGITGVPGVGKSTFIEKFGGLIVESNHKLAVLAVDPSSQQSHGSILGDKTRMESLASDKRAYIRPSPAGKALGGVSAKTREAMLLCEAAGFDVILIETVGVGQSETAVRGMVDFFLLLMLAGAGDELQGIKKGIIEMCDALVINKADGSNLEAAKLAMRDYANALHLFQAKESGWTPKVMICSGLEGRGLAKIWNVVEEYRNVMQLNGFWQQNRQSQRIQWFDDHIRYLLESKFYQNPGVKLRLSEVLPGVQSGNLSPIKQAEELVQGFLNRAK
jgi:LAO/AO transport system kinase